MEKGMEKATTVGGHFAEEGWAMQITLPTGKLFFDKMSSESVDFARRLKLKCEEVRFSGACTAISINERAHKNFEIQINGIHVSEMIHMIATHQECYDFYKKPN